MQKLHIGCGKDYKKGWINLDISNVGDMQCDIEEGVPFQDNEIDEILANNVLCQILKPDRFVFVMTELWRVTKPTGKIIIRVPNALDICSFQDPMDCRRFTDQSFTYMEHGHRRFEQYGRHYGFKPFIVELLEDNGRQMTFQLKPFK